MERRTRKTNWQVVTTILLVVGFAATYLVVPPGCFVKLPQTPDQDFPNTLPDGKLIGEVSIDQWVSPDSTAYPDWRWWVPDSEDTQRGGDYRAVEVVPVDGGEDGGLLFEWVCSSALPDPDGSYPDVPPETFGGEVATSSFLRANQILGDQNLVTVYYVLCDNADTYYVPERGYSFRLEEPTEVAVQLSCDAPCYAFLTHSGCEYEHFESCWTADDNDLVAQSELLPGLYMIGVEFPGSETEDPDTVHSFDLHVALNSTAGQAACLTESATAASSMEEPQCSVGETMGWSTATVVGSLEWSDSDDFFLACSLSDVSADKLGGMPDEAHRFEAEMADGEPRLLNLTVTFGGEVDGEEHVIAITGDPCGGAEGVIDCTWGAGSTLTIEGVSVFSGETLYAIVDGVGSNALTGSTETPYELTWALQSSCP
jgi:hypothetical protein